MTRSYCPTPDNCSAPKRGLCSCLGRKHSPETIAKMREAQLGRKRSPETIAKMREAWKKRANYIPIPDHLKSYASKLKSCGIRGDELRKALEAAP